MAISHAAVAGGSSVPGKIDGPEWDAAHEGNGLDWYNVRDSPYSATGDGVTDDTSGIASAITAAAASGGVVYIPAGTYITSPITLPPGVTLQGVNGQGYYNATSTVPNSASISRLKLKSGSTNALISPDDGGVNLATHVRIIDLALDCNGLTQPAINLPDSGSSISRFWRMDRVYVVNVGGATGYAVYIGNQNTACMMRDCVMFNGTSGSPAGNHAVGWYGSDGTMDFCFIGYWGGNGLELLGGASDETFRMIGGGVFTCTTGIVAAGSGAVLQGVSIDHHFNDGIYIGYPITLIGCWFHTNSRTTTNTWSNIRIANPVQVNILGCRAGPRAGETSNDPKYHIEAHATSVVNEIGSSVASGVAFGTAYTNYVGTVSAPTFPATTVAVMNTTGAAVQAFITNGSGAITAVTLGSTVTGLTIAANATQSINIPYGQTVAFTYGSGTPTWTWVHG